MNDLMHLVSDNEQDRASCKEWWREATETEKLSVWARIQQSYTDPIDDIMSRFAQLAFAEMAEEMNRRDNANDQ